MPTVFVEIEHELLGRSCVVASSLEVWLARGWRECVSLGKHAALTQSSDGTASRESEEDETRPVAKEL